MFQLFRVLFPHSSFLNISVVATGVFILSCGDSSVTTKHPNGALKEKYTVLDTGATEPVLHGLYQSFYESGQVKNQVLFQRGIKSGPDSSWSSNGLLKGVLNYQNGQKDGVELRFNSKGQKVMEIHYKNGLQHGPELTWNNNGVLLFDGTFNEGKKEGRFKTYNDDKTLLSEIDFGNDQVHGIEKIYCAPRNGTQIAGRDRNYLNGKKQGEEIYRDCITGKIISIINYSEGELHGPYISWPLGKKTVVHYNAGKVLN
jgi:antitoxin component YwqK of YwqJK toxin-antitoxin module